MVFMSILDRYKVKNIGWITLDNASNNDSMLSSLQAQLMARGIEFSSHEQRIRCFPHIVNLAIQAVLRSITNMGYAKEDANHFSIWQSSTRDVIALLRTLINKIRASSIRRLEFEEIQKLYMKDKPVLKLIRDVSTCWSSTHLMLLCATQLQRAIDIFVSKNSNMVDYRLNAADWAQIKSYTRILEIPHAFQHKLSAEKTPTLYEALPSFQKIIGRWEDCQNEMPDYALHIEAGLLKLQNYFSLAMQVPAYQLAILLHPSRRLFWFHEHFPDLVQPVREMFLEHFQPYQPSSNPHTPRPQRVIYHARDPEAEWADSVLGTDSYDYSISGHSLEAEVDAYFHDTVITSYTSIMTFWQENQFRYPTIFMLAVDILAIQGSSVPCERVFSSGKETMSACRNQIKYDLMEALQMMKFSINHGKVLDFTAGFGRKAELRALEELAYLDSLVPEDLTAFCHNLEHPEEDDCSSVSSKESDLDDE